VSITSNYTHTTDDRNCVVSNLLTRGLHREFELGIPIFLTKIPYQREWHDVVLEQKWEWDMSDGNGREWEWTIVALTHLSSLLSSASMPVNRLYTVRLELEESCTSRVADILAFVQYSRLKAI